MNLQGVDGAAMPELKLFTAAAGGLSLLENLKTTPSRKTQFKKALTLKVITVGASSWSEILQTFTLPKFGSTTSNG